MVQKTVIIVLVGFVVVVILIPLILSAVGIDLVAGRGGSGTAAPDAAILLRSADRGGQWSAPVFIRERRDPDPAYVYDIVPHPAATTTLFMGTKGAGLWRSEDAGATWREVRDSSGALDLRSDVYRVAVSSTTPVVMYLAAYQGGRGRVFRSEDGGLSFRQIYFTGKERYGIFDVYTPPASPDTVLVATGEGRLLVSEDGGRRWRFAQVFRDPLARLVMHPWYGNEGYVLTRRGQIFKTYDGGASWQDFGLLNRSLRTARAPVQRVDRRVIVHPFSRVSFTPGRVTAGSQTIRSDSIVLDPHHAGLVYRIAQGAIFRSVDGGAMWEPLSTFIDGLGVPVGGVAVHPAEPDTLMVSAGQAVYTSMDRGIRWSIVPFANRLPLREIYMHPGAPEIIFVAAGR